MATELEGDWGALLKKQEEELSGKVRERRRSEEGGSVDGGKEGCGWRGSVREIDKTDVTLKEVVWLDRQTERQTDRRSDRERDRQTER